MLSYLCDFILIYVHDRNCFSMEPNDLKNIFCESFLRSSSNLSHYWAGIYKAKRDEIYLAFLSCQWCFVGLLCLFGLLCLIGSHRRFPSTFTTRPRWGRPLPVPGWCQPHIGMSKKSVPAGIYGYPRVKPATVRNKY